MLFGSRRCELIPGVTSPKISKTGQRLDELIRERNRIDEIIDSIREEERKKEGAEWNKRMDAYFKQAYYTGTSELDRRLNPFPKRQKCYIKLIEKGDLPSEVKCIVVHEDGVDIMELPLFCPKVIRKKWIEGESGEGLKIDGFRPIDKERFYKEFDKTVLNLRRKSERSGLEE